MAAFSGGCVRTSVDEYSRASGGGADGIFLFLTSLAFLERPKRFPEAA
jgi:hypothetical protein